MPSVTVDPVALTETPAGGPVIGGVTFPRPSTQSTTFEPARSVVTLANGEERAYDKGTRRVFALTWSKLHEDILLALTQVARSPFVTYRDLDGTTYVVGTGDGVTSEAIPGTYPVRHSTSITLRERKPAT